MANPFLAMSEDFSSAQQNPALNPFLSGDFGGGGVAEPTYADNPFTASNPFSDFGATDYGTAAATTGMDFFGLSESVSTTAANIFSTASTDIYEKPGIEPLFSTAHIVDSNIVSSTNIFDTVVHEQPPVINYSQPVVQKPTDLDLSLTNTIASDDDTAHAYLSDEDISKPKRPPPPSRPIAPETKDLILSVTGHMELTSTHLLDRIPPTRTPSPVSMRDLHSPSPTPEHNFGDFLTDGDAKKEHLPHSDEGEVNLFDVDDVVTQYSCSPQQNSSPAAEIDLLAQTTKPADIQDAVPKVEPVAPEVIHKPARPAPPPARPTPPRPVRPSPPQKPPPPSVLPQRPPPIPPAPQKVPPMSNSASNEFSLFDAPVPQTQNKQQTTKDIMSLYSTPKKQEDVAKQIDFLSDDIPESIVQQSETAPPVVERESPKVPERKVSSVPTPVESPPKSEPMIVEDENSNFTTHPTTDSAIESESVMSAVTNESSPFSEPTTINSHETGFGTQPTSYEATNIETSEPAVEVNPFSAQEVPNSNIFAEESTDVKPTNIFEANIAPSNQSSYNEYTSTNIFAEQSYANKSSPFDAEPASTDSFAAPASTNAFASPASTDSFAAPASTNAFAPPAITNSFAAPTSTNAFAPPANANSFAPPVSTDSFAPASDDFDAFSAKFDSTTNKETGAFDAFGATASSGGGGDAWGSGSTGFAVTGDDGFGVDDSFDTFLTLNEPPPVPSGTPAPFGKGDSQESEDGAFNVFIKPREGDIPFNAAASSSVVPVLAPPPKSPAQAFTDTSPRFNPFDKSASYAEAAFGAESEIPSEDGEPKLQRTDSQETPPTPLFDDDVSQPLEDFPRIHYDGPGWEVQLRQPNKKKITGQRFWKKIFVKLVYQGDNPVVQLFNSATDKEPFQELPLQACYSVSDIAAQQYDQYGKIFTIKLQYVFYKERPGVRPGQVTKAERITNKLSQFAAYAIQGDYQGVKEFGSDLKKLGLPVEHAPQVSQLFKIGSTTFEDMKQFSMCIEEALFRLNAHRDRALHYKMEEVQITAVDELYVEQDAEGRVMKQIARVRLFFLGFLSGMPDVELGVNDMWRQGKEVVGRHDIIPVATEEWIRLEGVEFHSCVQPDEYQRTRIIRFKPPDACYIELMRFRIRPPKNRELPLQLKAVMCVTGNKVELRADALVPGFTSRSLGQVPCEDVMIRFPIPECWIYLFRVEKHFRYGSVKSAHRRTGKIKGIERFLGAVDTLQESLIEVTSGQAKYEHQHRSIVWRMPRLPKEGQGAYTTHNLVCRMALTSYDQIPEKLAEWCYVEFTMPATQASHTTVRSVSLQNHDSDEPPEKYVRYLARHEYKVGIEHTQGEGPGAYSSATISKTIKEEPVKEPEPTPAPPSSDSDSD